MIIKTCYASFINSNRDEKYSVSKAFLFVTCIKYTKVFFLYISIYFRSFVVYHKDNHEYRNSRHYPKMVLIEFKAHDMNSIVISAPNMKSLIFSLPDRIDNEKITIK